MKAAARSLRVSGVGVACSTLAVALATSLSPSCRDEGRRQEPTRQRAPAVGKTGGQRGRTLPAERKGLRSVLATKRSKAPGQDAGRLAQVATDGSAADETHCGRAYEAAVTIANARSKAPPEREDYVAACRRFPEEAQRCLVPRYQYEHREECEAVRARTDPALRELLTEIVRGDEFGGPECRTTAP